MNPHQIDTHATRTGIGELIIGRDANNKNIKLIFWGPIKREALFPDTSWHAPLDNADS